jgi:hypothetical protein
VDSTGKHVYKAEIWKSELAIALQTPRPGTPEGEAYQQLIDGTLRLGIVNYIDLLSRPTPIGKKWTRTYASQEEAEVGHHMLLCFHTHGYQAFSCRSVG